MSSKTKNKEGERILKDIIFEIQNQSQFLQWFLSYEKLADLMEISKEECIRKIYQFRQKKPQMALSGGFHEVDGDLLIDFLSIHLDLDDVANYFLKAGVFFSERPLYELREYFKSLIQNTIEGHKLDKELLLLLTAATIEFDDAIDSYLADKFEIEFFIQRSIDDFIFSRKINPEFGAEAFLKEYLNALIPTKILNFRDITREFRERTYYEIFGRTRRSKVKKKKPVARNAEMESLLLFFSLDETATLEDLKKRFKEMIKKYHPDVNKNGEEMTKKVILKYNRLVSLYQEL